MKSRVLFECGEMTTKNTRSLKGGETRQERTRDDKEYGRRRQTEREIERGNKKNYIHNGDKDQQNKVNRENTTLKKRNIKQESTREQQVHEKDTDQANAECMN